jgi:GAF domain-containing protein
VGADQSSEAAKAAEQLRDAESVAELLSLTAESFTRVFDAPACTISRVIGDLLVDLVQYRRGGGASRLGHGYLISDYPVTRAVIEDRRPETVHAADAEADPAETALLGELGFDSLLMVPIEAQDAAWGLVEVYGSGRRFEGADVDVARKLAAEAGEVLERLSPPPAYS